MPNEALAEELRNFRKRYNHSAFSLNNFVRDSLKGIDENRRKIVQVAEEIRRVNSNGESIHLDLKDGGSSEVYSGDLSRTLEMAMADKLHIDEPHTRMLLEMSVTYAAALYDGLISDLLITTFRHFPGALRSKRTLTTEELIGFPSREALIDELAYRDTVELTHESSEKQFSHFQRAFGIDVFGQQSLDITIGDLTAVRERRNLIVHNNGMANTSYVAKYCPAGSIGDPVIVDADSAKSDRETLRKIGMALINSFAAKFPSSRVVSCSLVKLSA